ncbi:MAG: ABC transporter substrate-binding protein [Acidimicrobiales bacterium]
MIILFSFGLVAAACGSSDDASSGDSDAGADGDTTAGLSGDPIVLGTVVALSGASASTGLLARQGAELAVEEINAAGGVLGRPLELAFEDSLGSPEEAVKALRTYDSEGVDLTWGYTTSSSCLAASPIAEELEMLMLSIYCQTNKMNHEEFSENFFRMTTNVESIIRSLSKAIQQEEPGAVDWVSISPDYEYGHNTVDVFNNEMGSEVADYQMLDLTWPPFQSPTYSDYITQLTDDPAQGVFSTLFAGDMLNMLKQQKPFGLLDDKIFATAGMDIDVLEPMSASGDLPVLWDALPYYAEAFDNPVNDAFIEAYTDKWGQTPTFYPFSGYIAVVTYAQAIEAAGSTEVDAVRDALEGITVDSPMGPITIRAEDHQAIFENLAVIKVVPNAAGDSYEVEKTVLIPGADVTSPPTPGVQNPFDVSTTG